LIKLRVQIGLAQRIAGAPVKPITPETSYFHYRCQDMKYSSEIMDHIISEALPCDRDLYRPILLFFHFAERPFFVARLARFRYSIETANKRA